jgi:hypothetical protein
MSRRNTQCGEISELIGAIDTAKAAPLEVAQQRGPTGLGFAGDNGCAMWQRLVGRKGRMKTSEHDRDIALPICVSDCIGAGRVSRHERDANEVHWGVEVVMTHVLIQDLDFVFVGSACGNRK